MRKFREKLAYAYLAMDVVSSDIVDVDKAKWTVDVHISAYITTFDFSTAQPVDVSELVTDIL